MKFLCVSCDEPMKLLETAPPDRGSLSVVYGCPSCAHRIAMLTNPFETQLVSSLGVKIGPRRQAEADEGSACPFSGMLQEQTADRDAADGVPWTPEAEQRLQRIPEFVRPMARIGIEKYAKDNGFATVDEAVVDRAKDFFGM